MTVRVLARATVAALAIAACSGDDDGAEPPAATGAAPSTTLAVGESVEIGGHPGVAVEALGGPDWMAADGEHLYVKLDAGSVLRLDAATGAVLDSIETGPGGADLHGCQGIGAGLGSVWSCLGTDVVRIDFESGEVVSTIAAGKAATQGHLGTGFDRVWVLQGDGSTLVTIDGATEELGEPIALPVRGHDLAVGPDAVWVVSSLDGALVAVEPDGSVRGRIDGLDDPTYVLATDDAVFVGDSAAVHRVDPATVTIADSYEGGIGRSGALADDGDGGIWVRRSDELTHLDAGGQETETFALGLDGPSPGDLFVLGGALWTAASEHALIYRIELE
jgi:hypothetical protein